MAVKRSPTDSSLYSKRAWILLELSKVSKALADAEVIIELQPKSYLGHFLKGRALQARGSLDEAVLAMREASLQHMPPEGSPEELRFRNYQSENAFRLFEKSIAKLPLFPAETFTETLLQELWEALQNGATASRLFNCVMSNCLHTSGTWSLDHSEREQTILWLIEKGGLSSDDLVEAGSENPSHNGYNRERSPFPMSVLHYEVHQVLPSEHVLDALLQRRLDTHLKDASGLTALQVLVKRFVQEEYCHEMDIGDLLYEDTCWCDARALSAASTLVPRAFASLLGRGGFVADNLTWRWLGFKMDGAQRAVAKWARRGQAGLTSHEAARMHSYQEMLQAIQAMMQMARQAAINRVVTAFLSMRATLGPDANLEMALAGNLLEWLMRLES
eukprot:CAMPEP_0118945144 /NCGR_PEP_ID=MMETSP1169-20130426/41706_1 /TAXON_ID=36882 /ORGANISM="Pyramimonas obovata, Strain CCMP722" /LENGTH=387 /DNA_ID=CAMNT_0006890791 /DNA_START=354 /DNA_END=1517 /DNA_ORIENTATION=-